jgi:hypothetical protein
MMRKTLTLTYGILILLTLATALISNSNAPVAIIMGISSIKFLMVAFQFMELKKANLFWKTSLSIKLALIILVILLIR